MTIESFSEGVLTVKVSGRLTPSDWQAGQAAAVARLRCGPCPASVLVVAEQFAGWAPGRWDDSPFQPSFNAQVGRMAIVGGAEWEDLALLFAGKGVRRMPIEYFPTNGIEKAREWLAAKG